MVDFQNVLRKVDPNRPLPDTASLVLNGLDDRLLRTSGRSIGNIKQITVGAGANNYLNIFSFTGPFKMIMLLAILQDVTDIADFQDVGFGLYDGTNNVDLTVRNPGGAVLNGYGVYSILGITEDTSQAVTALNSNQVRISQKSGRTSPYQELFVNPKYGVTNYVRLGYNSSSINVTAYFGLVYVDSPAAPSGLTAV